MSMSREIANEFAKNTVERWLKLNDLTVYDHSIAIEPDTIDTGAYESLIEEIAITLYDLSE